MDIFYNRQKAFVVLVVAVYSNMAFIHSLEDNETLGEPIVDTVGSTNIEKREANVEESSNEEFGSFIEEKLMHQSQALEHLIKVVDSSGDMIQKLIENLSKGIEKPKLPTKAQAEEVHPKPKNNVVAKDHPIVSLGRNIPKYGKLAKDLFLKDVQSDTDPTPLIEKETPTTMLELGSSRRSFGGNPDLIPAQQSGENKVNPWCPVALLCQKTVEPVCGFDDEFGYGKFEDICHMMRVNCYWKYNFALVNSCRPKL